MTEKIKCIIVDDETYAADVVQNYIDRCADLMLLARCTNVFELLDKVESEAADLIFLDIQMPQVDGMQVVKMMGDGKVKIIFTTAFQEYAVEAFDLNVVDYLLKPFTFERFRRAIEKVKAVTKAHSMKYAKSGISGQETANLFHRAKVFIIEHQSFLNAELRIDELAKLMNVNRNHLSQAINSQAGQTFWSFLNQLRLEEAKRRLIDPQYYHYTVEAIALDSGFNSISNFNVIFKKQVGMTPTEYRAGKSRVQ